MVRNYIHIPRPHDREVHASPTLPTDDAHITTTPIDHPDASIRPGKLDAIDTPADGEVPTYDSAAEKFKWTPRRAQEWNDQDWTTTTQHGSSEEWQTVHSLEFTLNENNACSLAGIFNYFGLEGGYSINAGLFLDGEQLSQFTFISQTVSYAPISFIVTKTVPAGTHTLYLKVLVTDETLAIVTRGLCVLAVPT